MLYNEVNRQHEQALTTLIRDGSSSRIGTPKEVSNDYFAQMGTTSLNIPKLQIRTKNTFTGELENCITSPGVITTTQSSPLRNNLTMGIRLALSRETIVRALLAEKTTEEIQDILNDGDNSFPELGCDYSAGGVIPTVENTKGTIATGVEVFVTIPAENCKILIEGLKSMHCLNPMTTLLTPRHEDYTKILLDRPTSCPEISESRVPILETRIAGIIT